MSLYVRQDTKLILRDLAQYQGVSLAAILGSLAIGARDKLPAGWRALHAEKLR